VSGDYRDASVQVRREIKEHFADELATCDRLREHAVGMFETWTGRVLEGTADGLLKALFARSTDTFTCAVRCVRVGYGAQAAMLNRSLFEDMVDAHWINAHPEDAAAQYADHHEHGRMLLADAVATFPNLLGEVNLPEFDQEERERLDGVFGKFGQRSWTRLNLHERVEAIGDQWTTEDDREVLRFMHLLAHRENNQTLHVSAQSLHAAAELDGNGRPVFLLGPRTRMVYRALFGAYWTFSQTATLVVDRFGLPMSSSEREDLFAATSFQRSDRPDRARFN